MTKSCPVGRWSFSKSTTTLNIVGEWKTLRISHISKTMKGKNERIAFAATEKANVCASVRARYCMVGQPRCTSMCFQGRNNSRDACDPGTGIGADSTVGETEPGVMEFLRNRNRRCLPPSCYKYHFEQNESLIKRVPLCGKALCKQSALQEPEFLNIMPCSRRFIPLGHLG